MLYLCRRKSGGNSSVGRAQPCQGWGREFESRFPLNESPFYRIFLLVRDALVVELVDTQDLKSCEHCVRAGSSPARSTE